MNDALNVTFCPDSGRKVTKFDDYERASDGRRGADYGDAADCDFGSTSMSVGLLQIASIFEPIHSQRHAIVRVHAVPDLLAVHAQHCTFRRQRPHQSLTHSPSVLFPNTTLSVDSIAARAPNSNSKCDAEAAEALKVLAQIESRDLLIESVLSEKFSFIL